MPTTARTGCAPSCSWPWTMSATKAAARSRPSRTSGWASSCAPCPPEGGDVSIRASVQPLSQPGHAVLRLSELDAAPQGLTLSIQRQQGPDSHLADDGWRRTEAWLQPGHVERKRDILEFHLGPEICDRLAGIATVRLRVREPDIGVVATTDRKSTRLNSSHLGISYAVFCLKKKKHTKTQRHTSHIVVTTCQRP